MPNGTSSRGGETACRRLFFEDFKFQISNLNVEPPDPWVLAG